VPFSLHHVLALRNFNKLVVSVLFSWGKMGWEGDKNHLLFPGQLFTLIGGQSLMKSLLSLTWPAKGLLFTCRSRAFLVSSRCDGALPPPPCSHMRLPLWFCSFLSFQDTDIQAGRLRVESQGLVLPSYTDSHQASDSLAHCHVLS